MLTLDDSAVAAIHALASKPEFPERSGLRIVHQDMAGTLQLFMSPGPEAGDKVVETGEARVFLQEDAATMLNGWSLGAEIHDDGVVFHVH